LWVERLNGVPNAASASGPQQDRVPDFGRFRRVVELIQAVQDLGLAAVHPEEHLVEVGGPLPASAVGASTAVEAAKNGMEYRPRGDGTSWSLVRKERRLVMEVNPLALGHPILEEIAGLLNLEPGRPRYEIVVGPGVVLDPLQAPGLPSEELQVSV